MGRGGGIPAGKVEGEDKGVERGGLPPAKGRVYPHPIPRNSPTDVRFVFCRARVLRRKARFQKTAEKY